MIPIGAEGATSARGGTRMAAGTPTVTDSAIDSDQVDSAGAAPGQWDRLGTQHPIAAPAPTELPQGHLRDRNAIPHRRRWLFDVSMAAAEDLKSSVSALEGNGLFRSVSEQGFLLVTRWPVTALCQ